MILIDFFIQQIYSWHRVYTYNTRVMCSKRYRRTPCAQLSSLHTACIGSVRCEATSMGDAVCRKSWSRPPFWCCGSFDTVCSDICHNENIHICQNEETAVVYASTHRDLVETSQSTTQSQTLFLGVIWCFPAESDFVDLIRAASHRKNYSITFLSLCSFFNKSVFSHFTMDIGFAFLTRQVGTDVVGLIKLFAALPYERDVRTRRRRPLWSRKDHIYNRQETCVMFSYSARRNMMTQRITRSELRYPNSINPSDWFVYCSEWNCEDGREMAVSLIRRNECTVYGSCLDCRKIFRRSDLVDTTFCRKCAKKEEEYRVLRRCESLARYIVNCKRLGMPWPTKIARELAYLSPDHQFLCSARWEISSLLSNENGLGGGFLVWRMSIVVGDGDWKVCKRGALGGDSGDG